MRRLTFTILLILSSLTRVQPINAQPDQLPPVYMANEETIWRIENGLWTEIFKLASRTTPLDTLSDYEQAMIAETGILNYYTPTELERSIVGMWSLPGGAVLVQVDHAICNHMVNGSRACAGYVELHRVRSDQSTQLIFTLDYHYLPAMQQWTCLMGRDSTLIDVAHHPVKEQLVLTLRKSSHHCDATNTWGLLVDYSGAAPTVEDIPFSYNFAWSADGNHLAYLDATRCINHSEPSFCRDTQIFVWTGSAIEEILLADTGGSELTLRQPLTLTWLDAEALVYVVDNYDPRIGDTADGFWSNLVSYHVGTGEIEVWDAPAGIRDLYHVGDYLIAETYSHELTTPISYVLSPQITLMELEGVEIMEANRTAAVLYNKSDERFPAYRLLDANLETTLIDVPPLHWVIPILP